MKQESSRKAKRYSVGYFHSCPGFSFNSALPFVGKRYRSQGEILEPQGFIRWLHNVEEKTKTNQHWDRQLHQSSQSLNFPSFYPTSLPLASLLVSPRTLTLGVFLLVVAAVFVGLLGQDLSVSKAEALVVLSRGLSTADGTSVFCKTSVWMHEGDAEATQKLGNCLPLPPALILWFLCFQAESHDIMEELAFSLAIGYRWEIRAKLEAKTTRGQQGGNLPTRGFQASVRPGHARIWSQFLVSHILLHSQKLYR